MAEISEPDLLSDLDVAIDPDFEPQKRPRSCTWPLPRPESNAAKPESSDPDIIPEEEDDEEDNGTTTTAAIDIHGSGVASGDQSSSSSSPVADGLLSSLGPEESGGGSPLSSAASGSLASVGGGGGALGGQPQTPRKSSSRRNAWGNLSYADLITKAIESTTDKRLTLSQIYDWMVRCVPYFKDKGDSNSSAGWKVSDTPPPPHFRSKQKHVATSHVTHTSRHSTLCIAEPNSGPPWPTIRIYTINRVAATCIG